MRQVSIDRSSVPPRIDIPADFNVAAALIERNLVAGRGPKLAYVDDAGQYTYAQLAGQVDRFANLLRQLGIQQEQRILLCVQDSIEFPVAFLGAIKAGVVPVAVNTLLTIDDYAYMLNDARAVAAVVSDALVTVLDPACARSPHLRHRLVTNDARDGWQSMRSLMSATSSGSEVAATRRDEPAFWLYSSGSTGAPKGTVHVHSSPIETAVLYAEGVLGLGEHDRVFSAAKLFFAYGLGNALTFSLWTGATACLMRERPTPAAVAQRFADFQPTVFSAVPTLYAALLASGLELQTGSLRRCISAGEALPPEILRRWREGTGVDILDGIGSTEMLHIFLSNRPGDVRPGTVGKPVPGYEARICDEAGADVPPGTVGELLVRGPTAAKHYWAQRDRSRSTFLGHWTRTGDKFSIDADGYYIYAARADDMLKVGGIYVSPIEVESALVAHPQVLEAAIVGRADEAGLVKPFAFVVLKPDCNGSRELADALQAFVKERLAHYKYPRWIEFVDELPKTATGKVQRFRLRERANATPAG